jgi:SAM-dependent methyltransferase
MNTAFPHDEFQLWGPIKPSVLPLWQRFYPNKSPLEFLQLLKKFLRPDHVVLEVGAGAGEIYPHGIRGTVKRLVGIDPDPRVEKNSQLDLGLVGHCEKMQFKDATFDVVFHRMLAEHLPDPEAATIEMARVLKPGGLLILHTPNKLHYSMIVSRFTPMWFHRGFMRLLRTRSNPDDVHFAYYRMNSSRDVRRICRKANLEVLELQFLTSPPGYLRFSPIAFLAGTLYVKSVEQYIPGLRPTIALIARKRAS